MVRRNARVSGTATIHFLQLGLAPLTDYGIDAYRLCQLEPEKLLKVARNNAEPCF